LALRNRLNASRTSAGVHGFCALSDFLAARAGRLATAFFADCLEADFLGTD
jgi:hypothetical protein